MNEPPRGRSRARALLLVALAAALALAACEDEATVGEALPETPMDGEPGFGHVHGLGRNPADGHWYAATHFGLWRLEEDGSAERVGDHHLDLMGFAVAGEDHFVASGHPPMVDDIPPHLGLIETTDAGETWVSRSLLGEADFHALAVADGHLVGFDATDARLLRSPDGEQWSELGSTDVLDVAVDPGDREHLVAVKGGYGADGVTVEGLAASRDGGQSFAPLDGPALVRLDWHEADRLVGANETGEVWVSRDGGDEWERVGALPGPPEALADAGDELAAAADGIVWRSVDGGRSWQPQLRYHE